jgi:hypothetical protein
MKNNTTDSERPEITPKLGTKPSLSRGSSSDLAVLVNQNRSTTAK